MVDGALAGGGGVAAIITTPFSGNVTGSTIRISGLSSNGDFVTGVNAGGIGGAIYATIGCASGHSWLANTLMIFEDVSFTNCRAPGTGGALFAGMDTFAPGGITNASIVINGMVARGNVGGNNGGVVYASIGSGSVGDTVSSSIIARNVSAWDNVAALTGGVVYLSIGPGVRGDVYDSMVDVDGVNAYNNSAGYQGGFGLLVVGSGTQGTVQRCNVSLAHAIVIGNRAQCKFGTGSHGFAHWLILCPSIACECGVFAYGECARSWPYD